MYAHKFAVAIKNNGKVLRERGDSVALPFGSEYSIFLKNMNSVRALVRIEIDGTDVTGGHQLIVPANGTLDLERFIKNDNMGQGNRFKFIERTKKIEDGPRGIKIEDGLVRVEVEFEREPAPFKTPDWDRIKDQLARDANKITGPYWNGPYYTTCGNLIGQVDLNSIGGQAYSVNNASLSSATGDIQNVSTTVARSKGLTKGFAAPTQELNDIGITVPGSVSDQKFEQGAWFPTDGVKHVLVLKLLGEVEGRVVEKPITVKTKPTCTTCGTVNKANAKFCRECGTGLTIV